MRGFDHATILSPSFHGVRKERLAQWPPTLKRPKIPGGTSRKLIEWGCAARFLKPLPYFRPKSLIFPTLFQTWSPDGARRVTREMVLPPNSIQFKTRVHKPYAISDQTKWSKLIPYLRPRRLKNHTLWRRTYPYSLYKGLPPPPPPGRRTRCRLWVSLLTQARRKTKTPNK